MRLDLDRLEALCAAQVAGRRPDETHEQFFARARGDLIEIGEDAYDALVVLPALVRIARAAQGVLAWRSDDLRGAAALGRLRAAFEEWA